MTRRLVISLDTGDGPIPSDTLSVEVQETDMETTRTEAQKLIDRVLAEPTGSEALASKVESAQIRTDMSDRIASLHVEPPAPPEMLASDGPKDIAVPREGAPDLTNVKAEEKPGTRPNPPSRTEAPSTTTAPVTPESAVKPAKKATAKKQATKKKVAKKSGTTVKSVVEAVKKAAKRAAKRPSRKPAKKSKK